MGKWWAMVIAAVVVVVAVAVKGGGGGWDKEEGVKMLKGMSERLGCWAMPVYVGVHTITLALCLPYAVFFEAAASLLFGFFPAIICVFSAKILGASLSFFIGRLVFRSSSSAIEWAHKNKYFHVLSRGVERDGWRFVVLARFSPIPSYVINYALAATEVGFLVDFLLPTVIGCLPMILQNTSIGSLAGAAVASASASASASGSKKSQLWSYVFPLLGIVSSILISVRIKRYSSEISLTDTSSAEDNNVKSTTTQGLSKSKNN